MARFLFCLGGVFPVLTHFFAPGRRSYSSSSSSSRRKEEEEEEKKKIKLRDISKQQQQKFEEDAFQNTPSQDAGLNIKSAIERIFLIYF